MALRYTTLDAAGLGRLWVVSSPRGLTTLHMQGLDQGAPSEAASWTRDDAGLSEVARQLEEYLGGRRVRFEVELDLRGTEFQRKVWSKLLEIPYGQTLSYGELARALGAPPGASRAVGAANGANPVGIIVPCHRVVGAGGKLVGYAGGLERKRWLLDLEARHSLFTRPL